MILERKGVKDYTAKVLGIGKLGPALPKVTAEQKPSQRIEQGERFTVIPCHTNEKLALDLEGTGAPGKLITVTPAVVKRFAFPSKAWQTKATIDSTGTAAFTHGTNLTPVPYSRRQSLRLPLAIPAEF